MTENTPVAEPLHVSVLDGFEVRRDEFVRGAEELGLNTPRKRLHPQQFVVADVLQAERAEETPAFGMVGVCIERRASKTTTILAVLLGRCIEREDYHVVMTAQTGQKARDRFLKDIVAPMERRYGEDNIPWRINRGRGSESIRFPNGSSFSIQPPKPDNFRGDAFDAAFIDEGQEFDPELAEDLLGAILPTFDTRPGGGQLVVAGTAGEHRSGLLWDTLQSGRAGEAGIVEYAAPDGTDPETYGDPELWARVHPGVGTLTTVEAVRRNFNAMSPLMFAREYLGIWPTVGMNAFMDQVKWAAGTVEEPWPSADQLPRGFALAMAVHPDQSCASIVAAWREGGDAYIYVLDWRTGTDWLPEAVAKWAQRFRTPVVHDGKGTVLVTVEQLNRMPRRPSLEPQLWGQVTTAAALLMKELDGGRLRHFAGQERLDEAARVVVKRGTKDSKAWAFGRRDVGDDITPLEAASMALRYFDERGERRPARSIMAA